MKLIIKGKKRIQGSVKISGSKNSAVAVIPAATLCDEDVILRNIPNIADVRALMTILTAQGFVVKFSNNVLKISKGKKISTTFHDDGCSKLRGSYYFMGAFLGKYKKIKIKAIGGCDLGYRPINYHIDSFQKMKAKYTEKNNFLKLHTLRLKGTTIELEYPSVGATINTIIAAVKAKGQTIITNAAIEPEVVDVCDFLNSMGADILGIGTATLTINGVKYLHKTDYTIIYDRIEAGTYLILGSLFENSRLTVENVNPLHLSSLLNVLEKMGIDVHFEQGKITVERFKECLPVDITTAPYPGFPTDLGPLISVLMLQANGRSTIKETIFSNRFSHVKELVKMGADLKIDNDILHVFPCEKVKGATLEAKDLRGAAALLIAACLCRATTTIENIDCLFRGYEDPLEKIFKLGFNGQIII